MNGSVMVEPVIYRTPALHAEEHAALAAIEGVRRELRYAVAEPRRWVGSMRRVLAARAIQGSNSIEGHHVSVEDALAAIDGEEMTDAADRDAKAVEGYRRAMTYVLQLAEDEHFEYSAGLIRSLHFMMTEYDLDASPGHWRPGDIYVRKEESGEVVYEGPSSDRVPALAAALVASLSESDADTPVLVRAAMAHLNLVMIHPFRDGNGRMSRGVQTLVLARERILAPVFSSIEEYLGRNTQRYYEVLGEVGQGMWHPGNDARPWVRFCLEAHYVQAMSVLRRIRESGQMWTEMTEQRKASRLHERTEAALLDAVFGLKVRNASYRAQLREWGEEVSNQTATLDLRAMVEAGLLQPLGKNRGAHYVAAEPLRQIRERARSDRSPIDTSRLFVPDDGQTQLTL
jgi:Fic family protein